MSKPKGFFAQLTPEQRKRALAYRGDDGPMYPVDCKIGYIAGLKRAAEIARGFGAPDDQHPWIADEIVSAIESALETATKDASHE